MLENMSIIQLLIIVTLVGAIVSPYFLLRYAPAEKQKAWLTIFFSIYLVGLFGYLFTYDAKKEIGENVTGLALIAAAMLSYWFCISTLAASARTIGGSAIIWCGLTIITSPFGLFVSAPWMAKRLGKSGPSPDVDQQHKT